MDPVPLPSVPDDRDLLVPAVYQKSVRVQVCSVDRGQFPKVVVQVVYFWVEPWMLCLIHPQHRVDDKLRVGVGGDPGSRYASFSRIDELSLM